MWEKTTPISGSCRCGGIEVHAVWDVNADETYAINWPQQKDDVVYPGSFVACYTLEGQGMLTLKSGAGIMLDAGVLLFVESEKIRCYQTVGEKWCFHWVEFTMAGVCPFSLNELVDIPVCAMYRRTFSELTLALRQNTPAYRNLAAATFNKLLHEWMTVCENRYVSSRHLGRIQQIIDDMHDRIGDNWTVMQMAQVAGMSESCFRKTFRSITGKSPKKFYDTLRISLAESLLRKGIYTVSEVAAQLGYSDPYHFSKEFKKHLGATPSSLICNYNPSRN